MEEWKKVIEKKLEAQVETAKVTLYGPFTLTIFASVNGPLQIF